MIEKSKGVRSVDRRAFLKCAGLLGAGLLVPGLVPVSESVAYDRKMYKITRTRLTMGTFAAITVIHPSRSQADEAIGLAFDEMDRAARLLSRYQTGSPVGSLNRDGSATDLPPEVLTVLSRAIRFHKVTGGAFDITVKPLVDLYRDHFAAHQSPPGSEAVNRALDLVDARALRLDGRNARFQRPGMGVTLDGIAKGYIIDCGTRVLQENRIEHGLINAGGDVRTIGGRDRKRPWTVAVQNPDKDGENAHKIHITNKAVATSGNYEVYFDREKLFHHIVNPENGSPAPEFKSVTVLSNTAMDADALSTAVFVSGPQKGRALVERLPGTECLLLGAGGNLSASSRWPWG